MISIKKELVVEASQEIAFKVFSENMNLWWPRSHHMGKAALIKMVLEPKATGRWYTTHDGGEECEIGFVRDYEPNSRLLLIWQLNGEFEHDSGLLTEVEVLFVPQGYRQTRVVFEHRRLEALGKSVEGMNRGWGLILDLFSRVAANGKLDGEALEIYLKENVD